MSGVRIDVTFSNESEDFYLLKSAVSDIDEQKSDIVWKIQTSDESDLRDLLDTSYMDLPEPYLSETKSIAENSWFWNYSSEWNAYIDDDNNSCIQVDYHLPKDSEELTHILKWINLFKPVRVNIESEETYDEEDMS